MVAYPGSVYAPRTKENLPGYPYTPINKYIGYVEDVTYLENEVLALIADLVGTGVSGGLKGGYTTLSARLANTDGMLDQSVKQAAGPTFDHIHLTTPGSGDAVKGPASAVDNYIAQFNGTTGKILEDSGIESAKVVLGPASATSNAIAFFDGTTGKLIKGGTPTIDASNNIIIPADSFTTDWTDWSASANVLGFSSSSCFFWYRKYGKLIHFKWSISGVSNSVSFTLTLPHASHASSGTIYIPAAAAKDNSSFFAGGMALISQNSSVLDFRTMGTGAWTASGDKSSYGEGFYIAAA